MFSALDVSTSALVAQRTRLDAISSNLANMSTTRNERGEPEAYTPRYVTFQTDSAVTTSGGGQGVKVASLEYANVEPNMKHIPGHPDANEDGYVAYPNVDMTTEFVDALSATRAYEANIGVIEITKNLGQQTLQILA
ncbi:MAG: flagellar basal body rod protein FlgC [Bythopirellula sp.]